MSSEKEHGVEVYSSISGHAADYSFNDVWQQIGKFRNDEKLDSRFWGNFQRPLPPDAVSGSGNLSETPFCTIKSKP